GKGLQERANINSSSCAKLPDDYSLEAAATIPDNFVTTFYSLSNCLKLALPTFPAFVLPPHEETPILIYGAGATSGVHTLFSCWPLLGTSESLQPRPLATILTSSLL
ncbi:uncharacterized protein EDB93DRAFT_1336535, partial [Suillus bovinus]|uniref:uncharacterized protein n=1 Tax=Suillus bovinus TaxID=48563 RepID=UPI001B87A7D9